MGLNWILGGSLLLLLLLLPAPSLWRGSAGVLAGASVEMGAVAGVAAVVEEGKGAAPLTELVAILVVAPATALVFEGTCPTPVGAGASAGDAAAAEAEATAEAACSVVDLLDGLLDASDMFVPHKSVMMSMCNCWGRARC